MSRPELTVTDLLEAVRASLWQTRLFARLAPSLTPTLFPEAERESLNQQLALCFLIG